MNSDPAASALPPPPPVDGAAAPAIAFYAPGQYRPDASVGYLMRLVMNSILTRVDARLADLDLTHAQWLPLYKLVKNEGNTMASLARDLGIDPGAMTRALDRLEAKGLVRRDRSTQDRRVVHLTLTDEGRAVAEQVPAVLSDVQNKHLAGFSVEEWQQLQQFLRRMLANGEALKPGCAGSAAAAPGSGPPAGPEPAP